MDGSENSVNTGSKSFSESGDPKPDVTHSLHVVKQWNVEQIESWPRKVAETVRPCWTEVEPVMTSTNMEPGFRGHGISQATFVSLVAESGTAGQKQKGRLPLFGGLCGVTSTGESLPKTKTEEALGTVFSTDSKQSKLAQLSREGFEVTVTGMDGAEREAEEAERKERDKEQIHEEAEQNEQTDDTEKKRGREKAEQNLETTARKGEEDEQTSEKGEPRPEDVDPKSSAPSLTCQNVHYKPGSLASDSRKTVSSEKHAATVSRKKRTSTVSVEKHAANVSAEKHAATVSMKKQAATTSTEKHAAPTSMEIHASILSTEQRKSIVSTEKNETNEKATLDRKLKLVNALSFYHDRVMAQCPRRWQQSLEAMDESMPVGEILYVGRRVLTEIPVRHVWLMVEQPALVDYADRLLEGLQVDSIADELLNHAESRQEMAEELCFLLRMCTKVVEKEYQNLRTRLMDELSPPPALSAPLESRRVPPEMRTWEVMSKLYHELGDCLSSTELYDVVLLSAHHKDWDVFFSCIKRGAGPTGAPENEEDTDLDLKKMADLKNGENTPLTGNQTTGDAINICEKPVRSRRASKGPSPLHTALMSSGFPLARIAEEIVFDKELANSTDFCGIPLLHVAAMFCDGGDAENVRFLLKHGADVNARDTTGQTVLQYLITEATRNMISPGGNYEQATTDQSQKEVVNRNSENKTKQDTRQEFLLKVKRERLLRNAAVMAILVSEATRREQTIDWRRASNNWTALHVLCAAGAHEHIPLFVEHGADPKELREGLTLVDTLILHQHHLSQERKTKTKRVLVRDLGLRKSGEGMPKKADPQAKEPDSTSENADLESPARKAARLGEIVLPGKDSSNPSTKEDTSKPSTKEDSNNPSTKENSSNPSAKEDSSNPSTKEVGQVNKRRKTCDKTERISHKFRRHSRRQDDRNSSEAASETKAVTGLRKDHTSDPKRRQRLMVDCPLLADFAEALLCNDAVELHRVADRLLHRARSKTEMADEMMDLLEERGKLKNRCYRRLIKMLKQKARETRCGEPMTIEDAFETNDWKSAKKIYKAKGESLSKRELTIVMFMAVASGGCNMDVFYDCLQRGASLTGTETVPSGEDKPGEGKMKGDLIDNGEENSTRGSSPKEEHTSTVSEDATRYTRKMVNEVIRRDSRNGAAANSADPHPIILDEGAGNQKVNELMPIPSPLHAAAKNASCNLSELVKNEAVSFNKELANSTDAGGHSLLYLVIMQDTSEQRVIDAKTLLEFGADVNAKDSEGVSILQCLIKTRSVTKMVSLVREAVRVGQKIDWLSASDSWTALHLLCAAGAHEHIRFFVEHGADPKELRDRAGPEKTSGEARSTRMSGRADGKDPVDDLREPPSESGSLKPREGAAGPMDKDQREPLDETDSKEPSEGTANSKDEDTRDGLTLVDTVILQHTLCPERKMATVRVLLEELQLGPFHAEVVNRRPEGRLGDYTSEMDRHYRYPIRQLLNPCVITPRTKRVHLELGKLLLENGAVGEAERQAEGSQLDDLKGDRFCGALVEYLKPRLGAQYSRA